MNTENNYTETDLGNIAPNPRGEFSEAEEYEYLDYVYYQGGSYLCLAELGTTIAGFAPEAGKTTQYWQAVALPGGLTPEYVAMHDRVVNLSEQVSADTEEVRESKENIEGMETNVENLQSQATQSAQEAEESKTQAAGCASAAEASRQAAETSEQNINAQVTGFDEHVAKKTSSVKTDIEAARIAANKAVVAQQEESVQEVKNKTSQYITEKQSEAEQAIANKQSEAVEAVNTAGATQTDAVNTSGAAQKKAVEDAGQEAMNNIGTGVDSSLSQEGKAADAAATGKAVDELKGDIVKAINESEKSRKVPYPEFAIRTWERHPIDYNGNAKRDESTINGISTQFFAGYRSGYHYTGSFDRIVAIGRAKDENTEISCAILVDGSIIASTVSTIDASDKNKFIEFIFDDFVEVDGEFTIQMLLLNAKNFSMKTQSSDQGNRDIYPLNSVNYYSTFSGGYDITGNKNNWIDTGTNYNLLLEFYTKESYSFPTRFSGELLYIIGDSISDQLANNSTNVEKGYYCLGENKWYNIIARNTGMRTIINAYGGTGYMAKPSSDSGYAPFSKRITDKYLSIANPNIILILGSINDVSGYGGIYTYGLGTVEDAASNEDGATYAAHVKYTLEAVKNKYPEAIIGVISMPPTKNSYPNAVGGNETIKNDIATTQSMNILLSDICDLEGLPFLDLYSEMVIPRYADGVICAYYIDSVHLTINSHRIMASRIREFIEHIDQSR